MAFVQDFSVSQTTDSTSFLIEDISTGTDSNIVDRIIFLQLSDGSFLVPNGTETDYIGFPLIDGSSIAILGVLDVDYAISITVKWLDIAGNILYEKTQTFAFSENQEDFDYYLTQVAAANRDVFMDANYVMNRFRFRMIIEAGVKAVEVGNDIQSSQQMMDMNLGVMVNETMNF